MGDHKTLTETPVGGKRVGGKRRITEKVAVVGAAAALAAGAIAGLGTAPANATCVGFSGIDIGTGCTTSLGTIAAVLGEGTAEAAGFFTGAISVGGGAAFADGIATAAWAGGEGSVAETAGILDWAVAQGTNVAAFAGARTFDFLNFAFNFGSALVPLEFDSEGNPIGASSWVEASFGAVNLAGNLGGNASNTDTGIPTPLIVLAGGAGEGDLGFGTNAANVFGNRNDVRAIGTLLNATAWGNLFTFPNGSDNVVTADGLLAWAFSYQGIFTDACDSNCGNEVTAEGPGAIAGAIGVIRQTIEQSGFGININNLFQPATSSVLAQQKSSGLVAGEPNILTRKLSAQKTGTKADGEQSESLTKAGSKLSESVTKAGKKLSSSVNEISAKLSKKGNEINAKLSKKGDDNVKKALGGSKKKKQTSEAGES